VGFRVAEKRLLKVSILAMILVAGLIMVPGILAEVWLKIQSFASVGVQFAPGRFQTIAMVVVTLGVGGWLLLGLLKDEYPIGRGINSPARKITYTKARKV
jgi:hypothetical protein